MIYSNGQMKNYDACMMMADGFEELSFMMIISIQSIRMLFILQILLRHVRNYSQVVILLFYYNHTVASFNLPQQDRWAPIWILQKMTHGFDYTLGGGGGEGGELSFQSH